MGQVTRRQPLPPRLSILNAHRSPRVSSSHGGLCTVQLPLGHCHIQSSTTDIPRYRKKNPSTARVACWRFSAFLFLSVPFYPLPRRSTGLTVLVWSSSFASLGAPGQARSPLWNHHIALRHLRGRRNIIRPSPTSPVTYRVL